MRRSLLYFLIIASAALIGLKSMDLKRVWENIGDLTKVHNVSDAVASAKTQQTSDAPLEPDITESDANSSNATLSDSMNNAVKDLTHDGKCKCDVLDSGGINFKRITNDQGAAYCNALISNFEFTPLQVYILRDMHRQQNQNKHIHENSKVFSTLLETMSGEIDKKLTKLHTLQKSMSAVLAQYEQRRSRDIEKLVKMYSNMKPKDAARIFMDLDMDILLHVADKMRETQLAPIVALMDTQKAKQLTDAIAKRHIAIEESGSGTQ